ncbi:MAG: VTC domain-containing protein, partial [bacterium]
MSGRLEYKYLVPNTLVDQIRSDLLPYMEIDHFAEKQESGEYTVRSVYYDTPGFHCYQEKMDGVKVRKKFRIRGYNQPAEDSIVFLEIKRKYENFIEKNRAPLLYKDLDALFSSPDLDKYIISFSKSDKEKSEAQRFLYHYYRLGLRPAVLVVYDREAFLGKFDPSLRLTFDKNLRGAIFPSLAMLYDEDCLKSAMPQHFIFEVKFFRG